MKMSNKEDEEIIASADELEEINMSGNESVEESEKISLSDNESEEDDVATHAAALKRLKTKDPDFYQFLKANDKDLLNFEDPEYEKGDSEEDISEDDDSAEELKSEKKISPEKLAYIKKHIRSTPTINVCKELISAFKGAVQQADGVDKKTDMTHSELFNDVVKLCLIDLVPALNNILKLSSESSKKMDPSKSKNWKKVQTMVRSYLIDMVKLLSLLKESSKLILLLKHVVHLVPFFSKFMKLCKHLLKKMITFWCSDEETVRVLSLIIIVRTRKSLPKEYFELVLKHMYFAYVRNSKFTSKSTWPLINFMKRSLTELYALNPEAAYEHTFVFVRQLAIHLRNAITTKKKESFQTVYNWQYVHCLLLWSHLVSRLHNQEAMKTLKYPLIQTIIGTITLIPTAKYVPLRFHLVKGLMEISKETGTFIPVMEFILDVLKIVDYNKKSSFSIKPVDFSCSLKGTKSQLTEAGYKDACISEVCTLLIEYLKMYSHSVGFPDLALKAIRDIKDFIKQCKVSKYNQQLKTLLGKIEENSLFICEKRRMVTFKITDGEQIKKWEEDIRMKGTPLLQFEKEVPETKDNKCKDVEESRKKKRKFNAKV